MSKKIIYALGLGGALGASLIVGGVATSNMFNGEKIPMTGEETVIEEQVVEVEYVPTPEQSDIVVEEVIDEVVEPKAEIVEETVAVEEISECERMKKEVLDTYGTLDFLEIIRRGWNGKAGEHLDQLGVKTWEEFKERFKTDARVRGATQVLVAEMFIKLDNAINKACE